VHYGDSSLLTPAENKERYNAKFYDQLIYDESLLVASHWKEASGGQPIERGQYIGLVDNGLASYPPAEIERIFYDWDDFIAVADTFHEDRLEEEREKRQRLLDAIQNERETGLLPDLLFEETKGRSTPVENEDGTITRLMRFTFTGNEASDDSVLRNYAKYSVAKRLLQYRNSGEEITEDRLVNIALGFNVDTGKALSSFLGSLQKSDGSITELGIEVAAEELGLYDFLYPGAKAEHLQKLVEAGAEEHYDLRRKKLVGKTAVAGYMQGQDKPKTVIRLSELLLGDDFDELGLKRKKKEVSTATEEECLEYGRWLVGIVEKQTGQRTLNEEILRRAYILRLGIGPNHIVHPNRFKSSAEFYWKLGLSEAKIVKHFHEFELDDFAAKVYSLGETLGRKPTENDINEYARQDVDFPSVHIIQGRGYDLRDVQEAAGWPNIYKWDVQEHEMHGARFMLANPGHQPTQRAWDHISKNKRGPSASIIRYKYPGGFSEFKQKVQKIYDELSAQEHTEVPQHLLEGLRLPEEYFTPRIKALAA
jgi:hypothetical protein